MRIKTYLKDLEIGSKGSIVGYDFVRGGYKGKLLSMGLTPGTEFIVIGYDLIDESIKIEVRGLVIRLCKYEADALCIEQIDEE
ncbi:MAG: FeoA family protein [Prochloraceae cyanobacterium]|nr:FeoA family protein [Prochloraceae cyanobacterium]